MPDLPNRSDAERELAAALVLLWAGAANATPDYVMRQHWAMPSVLIPPLRDVYRTAAEQLAREVGAVVEPGRIDQAARIWADARATRLADEVQRHTVDLASTAMSGVAAGQGTFAELMTAAFSDARAELIAATEVTRATTAGERGVAGYLATRGTRPLAAIWHTAEDDLVCEVCGPLNGTGLEVYGHVSEGGPPVHPRCRCWLDWG